MAKFQNIDVKEIFSNVPRSQVPAQHVEELADAILAAGILIRPLIVREVKFDSCELLSSPLEFYAAVRAREKDPRKGEMVASFLLSKDEDASSVMEQLARLDETPKPDAAARLAQALARRST